MRPPAIILLVLAVVACGPTTPTVIPTPDAATDPTTSGPSPSASVSAAASASPRAPAVGVLEVDPTLLDVLPADVEGVPRQADPETAATIAGAGELGANAEALAVALYVGAPGASGEVGDYAVVTVTRLRPGVYDDAFHRAWRDSFDRGVCEQAGGVDGNAEADIGGHRTFIGTCVGGVRTYHVHLPATDTLVSLQALGDARLGERIVEGLAE